jgi:hypothetical protein
MIGDLTIFCPPMAVRYVSRGLSRTDELHASGTLVMRDGSTWAFPFIFPSVPVTQDHWWDPIHWTVAECPAYSPLTLEGPILQLLLPPEPCVVKVGLKGIYMVAQRILAKGRLTMLDGTGGDASAIFPDCNSWPAGGMPWAKIWTAEAVNTQDGVVTWTNGA